MNLCLSVWKVLVGLVRIAHAFVISVTLLLTAVWFVTVVLLTLASRPLCTTDLRRVCSSVSPFSDGLREEQSKFFSTAEQDCATTVMDNAKR